MTNGPTLLPGVGGVGKTLLAQMMGTALTLGRSFIDEISSEQRVIMWCCEDDRDELWRRQVAICEFFGIPLSDLAGRFILMPRLGLENTLFAPAFGQPTWTPLMDELASQIGDYGATVTILDNVAQLYGCNENDRHQVTAFVNGLIGKSRGVSWVSSTAEPSGQVISTT